MAEPRFTYVSCDASFDPETGYAAVAACMPGRPLIASVVPCADPCEAERRAILAAMDAAGSQQMRCVEFRCDAEGAVYKIQTHRDPDPLTRSIQRRLQTPPREGRWQVTLVHRSNVQPAHELARFVLNAFRTGRESWASEMAGVAA